MDAKLAATANGVSSAVNPTSHMLIASMPRWNLNPSCLIENVSSYLRWDGEMAEGEFLAALASRSGCELLVDVNNIYVNARNLGGDPRQFIDALPVRAVRQIHLAGHSEGPGLLVDTHDTPVDDEVWTLYDAALERLGPRPTLIEWDTDIPELDVLLAEAARATRSLERAAEPRRAGAMA